MDFTLTSSLSRVVDGAQISRAQFCTKSGIVTILPHHEAMMSAVEPCVLDITLVSGETLHYALGDGIAHVRDNKLTILADMADDGLSSDREEIAQRKAHLLREIDRMKNEHASHGSMETMQGIIDMETQYLKESALEMLALKK